MKGFIAIIVLGVTVIVLSLVIIFSQPRDKGARVRQMEYNEKVMKLLLLHEKDIEELKK